MSLLMKSTNSNIRKKIITHIKKPYSHLTLAILGKRLRDIDNSVVKLIFEMFKKSGVRIEDFPTPESRMLVLVEGLQHEDA